MVGSDPEENAGGISSVSTGDSDPTMVKQWKYVTVASEPWKKDDLTLTITGNNNLPIIIL